MAGIGYLDVFELTEIMMKNIAYSMIKYVTIVTTALCELSINESDNDDLLLDGDPDTFNKVFEYEPEPLNKEMFSLEPYNHFRKFVTHKSLLEFFQYS